MQTQEDYGDWNALGDLHQRALRQLGSLCAMEAAAVRSYDNALEAPLLRPYRHALRAIRDSHEERTHLLEDRLRLAGGGPRTVQKISDSLLAFLEDVGIALGASTAFSAFDRGERHCLQEYRKALDQLDAPTRDFVEREILPRHIGTHALISTLRKES